MTAAVPAKLRAALAELPLDRLRVLEPASGAGLYLRHFGAGSRGLDRSSDVVAGAGAGDLDIALCDLDTPGWSRAHPGFEAAWLVDVLCHVADPRAFLAELRACLVPGAPVVSVEWVMPERGPRQALRDRLALAVPSARATLNDPDHLRTLRADELEELFGDLGYTLTARRLHSFHDRPGARIATALCHGFWPVRSWHFQLD